MNQQDESLQGLDFFGEFPVSQEKLDKNPFLFPTRYLSQDTINNIFGFLDPRSYINLKQTNRFFKDEIDLNPLMLKREDNYQMQLIFYEDLLENLEVDDDDNNFTKTRKKLEIDYLYEFNQYLGPDNKLQYYWKKSKEFRYKTYVLTMLKFSNQNIVKSRDFLIGIVSRIEYERNEGGSDDAVILRTTNLKGTEILDDFQVQFQSMDPCDYYH